MFFNESVFQVDTGARWALLRLLPCEPKELKKGEAHSQYVHELAEKREALYQYVHDLAKKIFDKSIKIEPDEECEEIIRIVAEKDKFFSPGSQSSLICKQTITAMRFFLEHRYMLGMVEAIRYVSDYSLGLVQVLRYFTGGCGQGGSLREEVPRILHYDAHILFLASVDFSLGEEPESIPERIPEKDSPPFSEMNQN